MLKTPEEATARRRQRRDLHRKEEKRGQLRKLPSKGVGLSPRRPRGTTLRVRSAPVEGISTPARSGKRTSDGRQTRPRILFLDIETAPLEVFVWGLFDQNIGLEQIKKEWSILSFCAKWLGESRVTQMDTGGRGAARVRDDSKLLPVLWRLLDEADIVVAQNGQRFDVKKVKARLVMAGFKPFSPIKVVDTLLVAQRQFGFTSNKLAWITKQLTPSTQKLEHREFPGITLWKQCLVDNPRAWRVMRRYNRRDVTGLEPVYLIFRPWIDGHPNVAIYSDSTELACPKCGSTNLKPNGHAYTQTGKYQRYRCAARSCGGFARSRQAINSKAKRASLLAN